MKKFLLIVFISLFTLSYAKIIDAIAIIVNNKIITTAEIKAVQKQMKVSNHHARELLIQDRLQKSAMKDIRVSKNIVNGKIKEIAKKNNITVTKMKKILKEQDVNWNRYRTKIREKIKKGIFFQRKIANNIPMPTEDELKIFYKNNKKQFIMPSKIKLIEYSSRTEKAMKKFLTTKKRRGIKSRSVRRYTKKLNSTLLATMLQTQNGSYTRFFNAGDRYIIYKVISKTGKVKMPYQSSKDIAVTKWKEAQRDRIFKGYFQKLRRSANIEILR